MREDPAGVIVGLYLCVFQDDDSDHEIEGVDVGSYDDFHALRAEVAAICEGGVRGSRFPVLMNVADSGSVWTPEESERLCGELAQIAHEWKSQPPKSFGVGTWQAREAVRLGIRPVNLAEFYIDVDGEPLLDRLMALAQLSAESGRPIEFL